MRLVPTTTVYAPSNAPMHVDGRHANVVSPASFAIEVSDNGTCEPAVRTAALQPPALRISIDEGRCYVTNLVVYTVLVDVGVPIFSPNSHGPEIRSIDVVGGHGRVIRLPIIRTQR